MKIKPILVRPDVVDVGGVEGGTMSVTWDVILRFGKAKKVLAWRMSKPNARRFARAFVAGMFNAVQDTINGEPCPDKWDSTSEIDRLRIDDMIEERK